MPSLYREGADGPIMRKTRKGLGEAANDLLEGEGQIKDSRLVIVKAKRLLKALDATYDDSRYKGLQRPALTGLEQYLNKVSC